MASDAQLELLTSEWLEASTTTTAGSPSSSAGASAFNDFSQPDTLWMLSLLCSHQQLLHTAARLYIHLRAQYDRKRRDMHDGVEALRGIHEQELSIMLGMTDADGRDVVVHSHTTQGVFERHSRELAQAVRDGEQTLHAALQELRGNFLSFFCVAAPDVIAAHDAAGGAAESAADFCRQAFSELRCPIWYGLGGGGGGGNASSSSAAAGIITTIRVVNPLRGKFVGARPKDPSLSGIVLDIAPLTLLAECLPLGRGIAAGGGGGGGESGGPSDEGAAMKVTLALKRLATNRNHALWIVGDARDLQQLLGGYDAPELLLDARAGWQSCVECPGPSSTAASCAPLMMKPSTAVWGGNFLFHWDPTTVSSPAAAAAGGALPSPSPSSRGSLPSPSHHHQHGQQRPLWEAAVRRHVRRVLHHCSAWNVDGLSVAFGPLPTNKSATAAASTATQATIATVLAALTEEIAAMQMDSNCMRVQHAWGMHYTAVRRLLPDFSAAVGPVPSASGKANFNLPFGVTVFCAEEASGLAKRIFEGDAEIVLPGV